MRQLRWVLPTLVCFLKAQLQARGTLTSLPILIALLLLSSGAWGQSCSPSTPLNCAYVTDGGGHDVLAVDRIAHTVTTIKSLKQNQGNTIDLRVGGDNRLYLLTPNNVFRMNLDGTGFQTVFSGPAPPSGFTGIRFDNGGDAFVNTPAGVWKFAGLIQTAGTKASPFPAPVQITTASCSASGGLAFDAFGDLLIVCNTGSTGNVLQCSAQGLASAAPCTTTTLPLTSGPITGLAVDALGDIFFSSGTAINSLSCGSPECNALSSGYPRTINGGADVPAYIEAVPDPTGTPAADPSSFPCNSAAPSILVSTADSSSLNGKVYSIDNVASATVNTQTGCIGTAPTPSVIATLSTKVPGVGMAAPGTLTTLTKIASAASATSDFNYGNASLELLPTSPITTACNLSMTKEQLSATAIASRLSSLSPSVTAITFDGEQSWVTGFHGAYDSSCGIDPASATHIGVSGFYSFINPHIVLIPDDPKSSPTVDELPFIYPIAPLQGSLGDAIIHNSTSPGVFTTTPMTIIVANVGFTNNAPTGGYVFCGFLSPFVDPPTGGKNQNTINSGQSATFKFQLGVGSCSNLVSDTIAKKIVTGFSVAQFAGPTGNAAFHTQNGDGKGNSVAPPTFKYDSTGHQFIYTLDTTGYCNGSYEATANGDSFQPHTLVFTVAGGC